MKVTFARFFVGMCVAVGISATFATGQVFAQSQGGTLEGSWTVEVTIRNCANGAAIRSFPRLLTFMQGGTMQEFAAGGSAAMPALRSPGHGVWETTGTDAYRYGIQFLRLNADGSSAGKIVERSYVQLGPSGNDFSSTHTSEIFGPTGTLLSTVCSTEEATRFQPFVQS